MALKRVLVVSESLSRGGLETRLWTQARALRARGHHVFFATASAHVPKALVEVSAGVFPGLAVSLQATAHQCASAAEVLARMASELNVDVIHAHPFASLLPAAMASALADKPLVVTLHGPSSLVAGPNADTALFDSILPWAGAIEAVSDELRALVPTSLVPRLTVVPNAVDLTHFRPVQRRANGPWAFIGRLEDGKARALETLVQTASALGIREWHVVGSGYEQGEVRRALATPPSGVKVSFIDWHDDVAALLAQGYAGVAGMGRVVLEAGAMSLPCILAGYGALHGLVNAERFDGFAWSNFSGRGAEAVTEAQLAAEMKAVDEASLTATRARIAAGHDEAKVSLQYEAMLESARTVPSARERLLQIHGLMRRSDAASRAAWAVDHSLAVGLSTLLRQPGEPFLSNVSHQLSVSIDGSIRAELAEVKKMVLTAQNANAPQLGEIQRALMAMGERMESLSRSVEALHTQLAAVKEAMPRPLAEQTRDVVAMLRGRSR
ncbi:MAG: glycosyltransferase family 4 protein [Myxococcaceae bacterium]|nr:glycosyltransferase family 4 protein [Myxococcaceae bacterium]